MVKEFLSQRGIDSQEGDVSQDRSAAQELVSNTGQMGVPVTIIDGQAVVGFDRARLEQLLTQSQAGMRPSFGASIADASKITANLGPATEFGAYIGRVRPGSVCERVGLVPGDIITEFNLQPVANASDLERALARLGRRSRFSLVFLRGDETMTTEGTL